MNRRTLGAATLAALLAVCLALADTVSAQGTVTINGQVLNGTAGAQLPAGLQVLALVTDGSGRMVETAQAVTDGSGRFQFGDFPKVQEGRYAFSLDYGGVFYSTALEPEELEAEVVLTVYETIQDVSVVRVTRQVVVIVGVDEKKQVITAVEFLALSNHGDRTLLPDLSNPAQMSFLRFSLPPGASGLSVQSDLPGREIIDIGRGFAVTSPVVPGGHSIEFSYTFPYSGDTVSFRQGFQQGADVFQVMVPDGLAGIQVEPLDPVDSINIQGTSYATWEQRDLSPGDELQLTLLNLPQPDPWTRFVNVVVAATFWQVAIPSVVGIVLASLLLVGAFKPSVPAYPLPEATVQAQGGTTLDRAQLVREVADLDERFQNGAVAEADYWSRRRQLKSTILGHKDEDVDA